MSRLLHPPDILTRAQFSCRKTVHQAPRLLTPVCRRQGNGFRLCEDVQPDNSLNGMPRQIGGIVLVLFPVPAVQKPKKEMIHYSRNLPHLWRGIPFKELSG